MLKPILFAALLAAAAPALAEPAVLGEGPAVVSRAHQYELRAADGREYRVQVAEPVRPLREGEKAAVVYQLDGNYAFGMPADVARNLQIMGEMAPAYVVSIGYPADLLPGWIEGRLRDYTHAPLPPAPGVDSGGGGGGGGGGGAAFQKFLVEELRPFIEARHPIDRDRAVLAGHSLGGLFLTNVLATQPEAFNGYVVGSPALWVQPGVLDQVRAAAAAGRGAGRKVYVGVGALETEEQDMVGDARALAEALSAPGSGYEVRQRVFADEGHITVQGGLFANGVSWLLPAPPRPAPAPAAAD